LPTLPGAEDVAMFGVFDGHGGEQVANFCEKRLAEEFMLYAEKRPLDKNNLKDALKHSFIRMDDLLRESGRSWSSPRASNGLMSCDPLYVGCTACVSCITERDIIVANAGDSRAVLCRAGRAVPLSKDHKPNDPEERRRIVAAGGYVERQVSIAGVQYRVNGNLNLSRALGDLEYKKDRMRNPAEQIISGVPDIEVIERTPEDEFLIICCDGIWDMRSNQEVVDFVRSRLTTPRGSRTEIGTLERLLDTCMSRDLRFTKGLGGDNMTAVLVRFPLKEEQGISAADWPRLLGTRLNHPDNHKIKPGILEVKVALPDGCGVGDVDLRLQEVAAQLEVAVRSHELPLTVDLSRHLPAGTKLQAGEPAARFYPGSGRLRIRLYWHRALTA